MTDKEKEARARQVIYDLATLKQTGLQPGAMFRIVRECENISAEIFARAIGITQNELRDIEECRIPFPTIFLISTFIYGIPEWYKIKECDAYDISSV